MPESTRLSLPSDPKSLPNWPCMIYHCGVSPLYFGRTRGMVNRSNKIHKCLSALLLTSDDFLINVHANGIFMVDLIIKRMSPHETVLQASRLLKTKRIVHSISLISSAYIEPWHKSQIIKEISYSILERNHSDERTGYTQQLESSC